MSRRQIFSRSRQCSLQLTDVIGSFFALELLSPSRDLYLVSPWIADLAVIRNGQAEVRALVPDLGTGDLWLSAILGELAERGTRVRIVCRPIASNHDFLHRLPNDIEIRQREQLHSKGLLTDHVHLSGSMNFTYYGLNLNDETVDVTTDPEDVERAHVEMASYWRSLQ